MFINNQFGEEVDSCLNRARRTLLCNVLVVTMTQRLEGYLFLIDLFYCRTMVRLTRMREMPEVKVYIVSRTEDPSGIGEPGVPVVAPAIGNAIAAATGKRLRTLPFGYTTPLPKG
jgi:hypothetical protein